MSYNDLSDEDKITLAIEFIATQQPMPKELMTFLKEKNLLALVARPSVIEEEVYDYNQCEASENNEGAC